MNSPRISVLLPVYNGGKFLHQSIQSVLNQTFSDFELIIINDGSTDSSESIIKKILDPRIRYIQQDNQGLIKTLNRGIKEARGEFIALIDSDDFWVDTCKLEKQLRFLLENPGYSLIGTSAYAVNEKGDVLFPITHPLSDTDIRKRALITNNFIHSTVLFKKDSALAYGGYGQKEKAEDFDLWLKMGTTTKFANLPDFCVNYTINSEGVSQKGNLLQTRNSLLIAKENRKNYPNYCKAWVKWNLKLFILKFLKPTLLQKVKEGTLSH